MQIWVDADACPVPAKEILFRAAQRTQTRVTLVANHYMKTPSSPLVTLMQVESGFDIADHEIVQRAQSGDLVITSDIPLAAEVIDNKVFVLSPRGEEYDRHNIKQRLNIRDFMDTMRASGVQSGGPAAYGQKEKQAFANGLDRILAQNR